MRRKIKLGLPVPTDMPSRDVGDLESNHISTFPPGTISEIKCVHGAAEGMKPIFQAALFSRSRRIT
jgi:hypothetical protein